MLIGKFQFTPFYKEKKIGKFYLIVVTNIYLSGMLNCFFLFTSTITFITLGGDLILLLALYSNSATFVLLS